MDSPPPKIMPEGIPKIIIVPWLRVSGMALWPFVLLRHPHLCNDTCLINHERIHHRQQLELGVLGFYIWYILEYGWHLLHTRNHHAAYMRISFEREAYAHDQNLNYLGSRPLWAFLRFL